MIYVKGPVAESVSWLIVCVQGALLSSCEMSLVQAQIISSAVWVVCCFQIQIQISTSNFKLKNILLLLIYNWFRINIYCTLSQCTITCTKFDCTLTEFDHDRKSSHMDLTTTQKQRTWPIIFIFQLTKTSHKYLIMSHLWPLLLTWFNFNPSMDK